MLQAREPAAYFLDLVPLCSVTATLAERVVVPNGASGTRAIVEVISMRYDGDRLKASLKGRTSADWLTIAPGGQYGTADVRCTIETDDGAVVFVQYNGRISFGPPGVPSRLVVAPRFDTGDDRYAWLNRIQAVGVGNFYAENRVLTYEFFEVRALDRSAAPRDLGST
jgi:hypothetical protein